MKTIGLSVTLCCAIWCGALAADAGKTVLLDDFEVAPQVWKYVGGEESPGAKGSAARDSSTAHDGKASYRLQADFSGGGAYVGVWRDLATLAVRDLTEIRLWIKTTNVTRLGVRINDATGQCHQQKGVPLAPTGQWQELVLKTADLAGEEHWGGMNDGQWHGPPTGFGLNVGSDSVGETKQGALWLDDVRATVVPGGQPTLLPCSLSQTACRPAYGIGIKYRWEAEPMAGDYQVFVHIRNSTGKIVVQDDHAPPVATSRWSGRVEYKNTVMVPPEWPLGEYVIVAGLWNSKGGAKLGRWRESSGRECVAGRRAEGHDGCPPAPTRPTNPESDGLSADVRRGFQRTNPERLGVGTGHALDRAHALRDREIRAGRARRALGFGDANRPTFATRVAPATT